MLLLHGANVHLRCGDGLAPFQGYDELTRRSCCQNMERKMNARARDKDVQVVAGLGTFEPGLLFKSLFKCFTEYSRDACIQRMSARIDVDRALSTTTWIRVLRHGAGSFLATSHSVSFSPSACPLQQLRALPIRSDTGSTTTYVPVEGCSSREWVCHFVAFWLVKYRREYGDPASRLGRHH